MITVIIATRNRSDKLFRCINSIFKNNFKSFEVIVIDQSHLSNRGALLNFIKSKKLKYIRTKILGKSKALNLAITDSKGDILAFTDDDCLVAKNWLSEIAKSYKKHPNIGGVFGNIYPFGDNNGKRGICPATMNVKSTKIHRDPSVVHYRHIGNGNNMSIKRSTLKIIGPFNEMLSPGTFGLGGGEDSEIIFRILKNKIPLLTNPKMIVYHDRWLTGIEEINLQSKYTAGLVAFQIQSYLFGAKREALILFKNRVNERLIIPVKNVTWIIRTLVKELFSLVLQVYGILKGLFVGIYIYLSKTYAK